MYRQGKRKSDAYRHERPPGGGESRSAKDDRTSRIKLWEKKRRGGKDFQALAETQREKKPKILRTWCHQLVSGSALYRGPKMEKKKNDALHASYSILLLEAVALPVAG